jgi:hypothetical protein
MPKTKTNSSSIRRVAFDGYFLDYVQTRPHSERGGESLSYLSALVERHRATEDAESVTLTLPALTAPQLLYDDVLTADARKSVDLTIGGRPLGAYWPGRALAAKSAELTFLKPV